MLEKLLFNRRSIRVFEKKKVEKEKIQAIIKGALTAPTGRNLKPVEIIVIEDESCLKLLGKARGQVSQFVGNAPLAFVIIGDTRESTTLLSDTAITATFIQLLAVNNGLASCWAHVENRKTENGTSVEDTVRKLLNIPEYYKPICIIAVGYSNETKEPHNEAKLDYSKVHSENYGKIFN